MLEVWKPYDERFWVSNLGRVFARPIVTQTKDRAGVCHRRVIKGRLLRGSVSGKGYRLIETSGRDVRSVHRMVAKAFCLNPDGKPHVNHIDGNPANNSANNLEWCTPKENMTHARAIGLIDDRKAVRCVDTGEVFASLKDAATARGRSVGNLCTTLKGGQKTWDGHRWEYAELRDAQVA